MQNLSRGSAVSLNDITFPQSARLVGESLAPYQPPAIGGSRRLGKPKLQDDLFTRSVRALMRHENY